MINLQLFIIVKPELLQELANNLGVTLDNNLLTLFIANFFAYLIIYVFIKCLINSYFILMPKRVRKAGIY